MSYLLIVCGDCNDADYAYKHSVISEQELLRVKEMLESIKRVREVYGEYHPEVYKSWHDKLPYFGEVYDAIPDRIKYSYDGDEDSEDDEDGDEWLQKVNDSDLSNLIEFYENYIPYGTSDNDYVHTIVSVEAYKLEENSPIMLA